MFKLFEEMKVGDQFYCWTDDALGTSFSRLITAQKTSETTAHVLGWFEMLGAPIKINLNKKYGVIR